MRAGKFLVLAAIAFQALAGSQVTSAPTQPNEESTRLTQRGIDLSENQMYEGAIKLFDRAIKADPKNPQAYQERAMALLNLDRNAEAVADFEQALKLDPVFPGARNWLGHALVDMGDHRRAAEEWLRDLRDHPNGALGMGVSPQSWTDCAEQFALAGEKTRAITLLEEYFSRHASRVTSYAVYETSPMRLLAALYTEVGRSKEADALRKRARASSHRVPADE